MPKQALSFRVQLYGMNKHRELFTARQLVALTTFSQLLLEVTDRICSDVMTMGGKGLSMLSREECDGAKAYADAVATFLAFGIDKNTLTNCTQATWQTEPDRLTQAFSRQALPMTWDYAEANPLSNAGGGFILTLDSLAEVILKLPESPRAGSARQFDSTRAVDHVANVLVATDPPYYDNIGYADLSDFFYIWLRRSLGTVYPELFSTLLTPKAEELVATPFRFGGDKYKANRFFEEGLSKAFARMHELQHPEFPLAIYYAFKQAETDGNSGRESPPPIASTGWETMLQGLVDANFSITGTWPMRTELIGSLKKNIGALASSIVLICRRRPCTAPAATRRAFVAELKREMLEALTNLQHGNIAPVDLAQAAIGPGMAIFSKYGKVLEADGHPMRVRTALQLINQVLDEVLTEQEGEFDADTRWAIAWFEQHGMDDGPYGMAEILSKAKVSSIRGLEDAGILVTHGSKVRLRRRDELVADWEPGRDRRLTIWEVTQHLIRALDHQGEQDAAALLRKVGAHGEIARDLAYRLYTTCERKGWAQEALAYNSLVVTWPELNRLASQPIANEQLTLPQ